MRLAVLTALTVLPLAVLGECECSFDAEAVNQSKSLPLKLAAVLSILISGAIGVCLPITGKWIPTLRPESDVFFLIKAFAAGVILATGFIHIFPDPFAGLVAMMSAIGTLMVDTVATGYYTARARRSKARPIGDFDKENGVVGGHDAHVPVHTHATHGHTHGSAADEDSSDDLVRHRIISHVLELGIVVHSVIIGISLGASQRRSTIRSLVVALSFHQFFEGMGLGGCLVQAQFKVYSMATMIIIFSVTTPIGIATGIGISSVYNERSPTALIVQGVLDSASAGILIYMALVDLLAADFMNPRVQSKGKLQLGINVSLLVGAGLMSLLAKWA